VICPSPLASTSAKPWSTRGFLGPHLLQLVLAQLIVAVLIEPAEAFDPGMRGLVAADDVLAVLDVLLTADLPVLVLVHLREHLAADVRREHPRDHARDDDVAGLHAVSPPVSWRDSCCRPC
jgi:hypothetical protein